MKWEAYRTIFRSLFIFKITNVESKSRLHESKLARKVSI